MTTPPRRSRLPFLLDTAAAVYAAALVVRANATFMRPRAAMLQWDEGYALAFARRMLEGGQDLPYVDGVSPHGPVFEWIVALAVKAYGFGTWMPMRALTLASMLSALAVWFLAACVARRSLPGAVMALGLFIVCVGGMHRPWEGPAGPGLAFGSEHLVNVFVGAALLSMTLAFPSGSSRPRFYCVGLCGASVAMAGLSEPIGLIAALPFALWTLAVAAHREDLSRRARGAIVVTFGAGLLSPVVFVVLRYSIARELGTLYRYTVGHDSQHFAHASGAVGEDYSLHGVFAFYSAVLLVGACLAGWGASRVFARAPGEFFRLSRRPRLADIARAYSANAFEVTVAVGFIVSLAGGLLGLHDGAHDYLPIVPWGGLLAGLLIERAIGGIGSHVAPRPWRVVLVRASVLLPLALLGTLGWRQRARDYATRADVLALFDTEDWPICKFLRKKTKPRDSIFIWGPDPAPYTACNRRAASRFLLTTSGSQEQLLDDLSREKPAFVFDSDETSKNRAMMDSDRLRAFLLSSYCRDLDDGPDVWARRPAGGCAVRMRPFVSFWSPEHGESLAVASDESVEAALAAGYETAEGQEGYVFDGPQPGTTALKLYQDPRGDWLTTASPGAERDAVAAGYELVRVEGYVFASQESGTLPLKLLYNATLEDNLTTASTEEESAALRSGYAFVRIEGYVTKR
jgi:hypothetical protein